MGKAGIRKLLNLKNSKGLENSENFQNKLKGYQKQLIKHIKKFKEAKARGADESMNYMAKEMSHYLERKGILKSRLSPKKSKKRKN